VLSELHFDMLLISTQEGIEKVAQLDLKLFKKGLLFHKKNNEIISLNNPEKLLKYKEIHVNAFGNSSVI